MTIEPKVHVTQIEDIVFSEPFSGFEMRRYTLSCNRDMLFVSIDTNTNNPIRIHPQHNESHFNILTPFGREIYETMIREPGIIGVVFSENAVEISKVLSYTWTEVEIELDGICGLLHHYPDDYNFLEDIGHPNTTIISIETENGQMLAIRPRLTKKEFMSPPFVYRTESGDANQWRYYNFTNLTRKGVKLIRFLKNNFQQNFFSISIIDYRFIFKPLRASQMSRDELTSFKKELIDTMRQKLTTW